MIIIELKKYYTTIKMKKFIKIIFFIILNFCLFFSYSAKAIEKIKIGLLVPMTGLNKDLGQSIIKAVRLGIKDAFGAIVNKGSNAVFDEKERFVLNKYQDIISFYLKP